MTEFITRWLGHIGLAPGKASLAAGAGMAVLALVLAVLTFLATRIILPYFVARAIKRSRTQWDDIFLSSGFLHRITWLAPAAVLYTFLDLVFPDAGAAGMARRIVSAYMILMAAFSLDALLNAIKAIYRQLKVARRTPIQGYIQAAKILIFFLTGVFVIAVVLDKSPWGLLSVMGGLTAILLLIFKDTILGFVASVQLSAQDMVREGDWIQMPKYGADGDVIEVNVNTVKVRNWDKTITTIPTYTLISDSFVNWRGMEESGGRRIKRAVHIDMNSIRFCSDEMLRTFRKISVLGDYLDRKQQEIDEYNRAYPGDMTSLVNGRRQTNIGVFRAYVEAYLRRHPRVHQELTFLVRHLAPTAQGLPVEIYVFSNDQVWAHYEAIQADIFDHILAVLPEFGLRVYQSPSGRDIQEAGDRLAARGRTPDGPGAEAGGAP